MSKQHYDYAAEMLKIAESQEHKSLFQPLEKLAFSRDGKVEPSEIESEFAKVADSSTDKTECDKCHKKDCTCDESKADDGAVSADENAANDSSKSEDSSKEAVAFSTYAVDALLKIADGLETEGFERLSAASLILADNIVKEAKAKKEKSKSKSKSSDKKKMTEKEKAEKAKKDKEKSKSKSSKK